MELLDDRRMPRRIVLQPELHAGDGNVAREADVAGQLGQRLDFGRA